jgi:hypothetical protein
MCVLDNGGRIQQNDKIVLLRDNNQTSHECVPPIWELSMLTCDVNAFLSISPQPFLREPKIVREEAF